MNRLFLFGVCAWTAVATVAKAEDSHSGIFPPPSPELLQPAPRSEPQRRMHPNVVLLDTAGRPVATSGGFVNFTRSCGTCHDTVWIGQHGYHFRLGLDEQTQRGKAPSGRAWDFGSRLYGRWDPLAAYDSLLTTDAQQGPAVDRWVAENRHRLLGGGPASLGDAARSYEPNCAACHVRGARMDRARELTFEAAQTATLQSLGLVEVTVQPGGGNAVRWDPDAFLPDGSLDSSHLALEAPSSDACGQCHGLAGNTEPRLRDWGPANRLTETTGQLYLGSQWQDEALSI